MVCPIRIDRLQTIHLAPDPRAIGAIEVEQWHGTEVSARIQVGVDEVEGQIRPPAGVEVHGQEGDLARRVAVAKPMIELDTVEDLNRIRAAHMLSLEVTVAVADPVSPPAFGESTSLLPQGLSQECSHDRAGLRGEHLG